MRTPRLLLLITLVGTPLACGGKKGDDTKQPVTDALTGLHASADTVLDELAQLETKKDVTCWTSFRQLDWFIAEKSYSEFGTLAKITAVKGLVRATWEKASANPKGGAISEADVKGAVKLPDIKLTGPVQQNLPAFANDIGLKNFTDYQKTAEHTRMVLAVIQDEMYSTGGEPKLKPLDPAGVRALTDAATTLSLMMLKESGKAAETAKSTIIEGPHVQAAYKTLITQLGLSNTPHARQPLASDQIALHLQPITKKLIDNKVSALLTFNKGTQNMVQDLNKVTRIPLTEAGLAVMLRDAQSFVHFLAAGFEPMQADNYLSDGSFAKTKMARKSYIDEEWAQNVVMQLFPHHMQPNGDIDVKFEVNPGPVSDKPLKGFAIKMLDHEMNGVRDSAIHWIAMQNVWKERAFAMDPFAAEYVSEVVSMMVTLWIRRGESIASELGKKQIDAEVANKIRNRSYVMVPPAEMQFAAWTDERKKQKATVIASVPAALFKDTSKTAGLPTKFATWNADLDSVQAHVEPDLKGQPGHVEPDKDPDTKNLPGHIEPTTPVGGFNLQTIMGGGIAVGDLDGDEYPDLFLTGEELGKLYVNKGKAAPGTFVDATVTWGLPEIKDGHGTLFFDLEGDGDLDLLVLRSEHPSAVFRNDKGKFTDIHAELGFETHRGGHVAHIFDFDRDGDLDIYVGYYGAHASNMSPGTARSVPSLDGRNGSPNQLWRNDGAKFVNVAKQAKVDDVGWCLALASADIDFDGDLDLFLANDFGADVFYKNNGDGTFSDITELTGTGDRGSGMNAEFGDVDGDGKWDIYVTNIDMFSKNIKVIFPRDESTINVDDKLTKAFQYIAGNKLYVSTKQGGFRAEENLRMEPIDRGWGWDASFFDYENDGDDDLYVTNGWINGSYAGNQKNQMYLNHEGFLFLAPQTSPEAFPGNTRSAAALDLDLDGDLDLVSNQFRQPPRVLINQQVSKNNFVQLRLSSAKGKNPRAIGAQIQIAANGKTILRQVTGGRGYLSQSDALVTAGIAKAATVDITIRWPDGSESKHAGLAANKRHAIAQP